jgi:hypothetical protein
VDYCWTAFKKGRSGCLAVYWVHRFESFSNQENKPENVAVGGVLISDANRMNRHEPTRQLRVSKKSAREEIEPDTSL